RVVPPSAALSPERPTSSFARRRSFMGALCPRRQRSNPHTVGAMADMGSIYAEGRTRLTELVASADREQHTARVPGCPQWGVRDLTTHEQDIRGALGRPGARDAAGIAVGLDFAATMGLAQSIASRGLPALRVAAGEREWVVGDGDPAAELEGSPFDLFRAMTG